jgi:glyoxylase-like metal-dependent hydrolase (beta-lactamase superfamily II)
MHTAVFLTVLLPATLFVQGGDLYDIHIERVTDHVYVAMRPEPLREYVEGNVTIIVNDRDVVVVDAGGAPTSAVRVIAGIKRITSLPVRYVVFTHIHRDHRFGAGLSRRVSRRRDHRPSRRHARHYAER